MWQTCRKNLPCICMHWKPRDISTSKVYCPLRRSRKVQTISPIAQSFMVSPFIVKKDTRLRCALKPIERLDQISDKKHAHWHRLLSCQLRARAHCTLRKKNGGQWFHCMGVGVGAKTSPPSVFCLYRVAKMLLVHNEKHLTARKTLNLFLNFLNFPAVANLIDRC